MDKDQIEKCRDILEKAVWMALDTQVGSFSAFSDDLEVETKWRDGECAVSVGSEDEKAVYRIRVELVGIQ